MKVLKKSISIICILTLLTSIICISTVTKAVSGSNTKIKWSINKSGVLSVSRKASSGTTTISDYNSNANKAPWNKYASQIKSVKINANITKIGAYAFWGLTKATKITIGKSVTEMGAAPFGHCDNLTSFSVTSGNTAFKTNNGVLYNKAKTMLVAYPAKKSEKTFTCPSSVKTIKAFAFNHNKNLVTFTHNSPGNIETINSNAFSSSEKLETVSLKNNIIELGNKAFYDVTTLKSVTIPPSVTKVGNNIFSAASKLKNLRIYCSTGSKIYEKLLGKGYTISTKKWTFTCKYKANGGSISSSSKTVTFNEKYGTLPTPKKTGYTFTGWYLNGKKITSSSVVSTPNTHTIDAKYEANNYTINLDANGGICNTDKITVTFDKPFENLPIPTRAGYMFLGWFTTPEPSSNNNDNSGNNEEENNESEDDEYFDEENEEEEEPNNNDLTDVKITTDTIFNNINIKTLYARWQQPCETVSGLTIEYNTKNSVKLSWNKQENISGYEIYAKINDGDFNAIKAIGDNSVTLELEPQYKYTFKVRSYLKSVEGAYFYGDFSDEVLRDKTSVNAPTLKRTYKSGSGLLTVKWNKVDDANSYEICQYKNKKWKKEKTTTSTAFNIYVKQGKNYKFRVRAVKTVLGHKYYSDYSTLNFNSKVYLKTPKVKGKFTKNHKYLKISWKKVKGAKGYKVYRYINNKWKKVKTTKKTSYKFKTRKYNTYYRVKVRAYKKFNGKTYYSNYNGIKAKKWLKKKN